MGRELRFSKMRKAEVWPSCSLCLTSVEPQKQLETPGVNWVRSGVLTPRRLALRKPRGKEVPVPQSLVCVQQLVVRDGG